MLASVDYRQLTRFSSNDEQPAQKRHLALDYKPTAKFQDIRVTDTLQNAPAQAFDVLEALIWPDEKPVTSG